MVSFLTVLAFSENSENETHHEKLQHTEVLKPMRNSRMIGAKRSNKVYIGSSQTTDTNQESTPKRFRSSRMMGAKRAGYVVVDADDSGYTTQIASSIEKFSYDGCKSYRVSRF